MLKKIKSFFELLSRMLSVLDYNQKRKCKIVFICIFWGGLLEMIGLSSILPFVELIISPNVLMENATFVNIMHTLGISTREQVMVMLALGVVLLYVIKNLFLTYSTYIQAKLVANIRYSMSEKTFSQYVGKEYSFFVNENSSIVIRGLTSDIDAYLNALQNYFNIGVRLINIVLIGVYLLYTDIFLTSAVVGLGAIILLIVTLSLKKPMRRLGNAQREATAEMLKSITQTISGIKEVKVLGKTNYFIKKYSEVVKNRCKIDIGYTTLGACPERIIETFFIGGFVLVVACMSLGKSVDATFVSNLSIFAVASFRLLPFVSQLSGCINILTYSYPATSAAVANLQDKEKQEEKIHEEDRIEVFDKEIRLEKIKFSYGEGLPAILDNVDLNIKKGTSVAFVGTSGAGKTTLADIILGLNKIIDGNIIIDDKKTNVGENSWGKIIGYVSQNVFLLDDTIKNNIAFGCHENEIDYAKLQNAINQAQLSEYINSLSEGIETNVGEGGTKLSGGQRQRIAIARALYFEPEILILDEATSALDGETEKAVMDAIDMLKKSKTLIIVAHRLSTIQKCECIYEVKEGTLIEKHFVNGILK